MTSKFLTRNCHYTCARMHFPKSRKKPSILCKTPSLEGTTQPQLPPPHNNHASKITGIYAINEIYEAGKIDKKHPTQLPRYWQNRTLVDQHHLEGDWLLLCAAPEGPSGKRCLSPLASITKPPSNLRHPPAPHHSNIPLLHHSTPPPCSAHYPHHSTGFVIRHGSNASESSSSGSTSCSRQSSRIVFPVLNASFANAAAFSYPI